MLAFDQPYEGMSYVAMYDAFQKFLIKQYSQGKRNVVIVDEAQNVSPLALESLRMLSNINADKDQLLQIILVGQPQLRDTLRHPDLKQFMQRVSVEFYLPPMAPNEVKKYIHHRLNIAGRVEPLFTDAACSRIADASGGIPRSINTLCDTVMVYGFSSAADQIDVDLVDEVIQDKNDYGVFSDNPIL